MTGVMSRRLVLASASPARLRLLQQAGFAVEVMVSGVDEDLAQGSAPAELVLELAVRKASAVAAVDGYRDALVLGCDSMFELDGSVYGKPASADEAVARWRRMRGKTGTLFTGHCVVDGASGGASGGRRAAAVDATLVRFGEPTDAEIDAYVATGEPLAVAGGSTLDGRSAPFVDAVEGNPGTVIGLSLPVLRALLRELGVEVTDLWF
jgi:septum formation protein